MNCKPGDLAYIVAPYFRREVHGHVVLIERAAVGPKESFPNQFGGVDNFIIQGASWVCSGHVTDECGRPIHLIAIADVCLRPINRPTASTEHRVIRELELA